jgi:hypoxia-inducible factor (prolyl hydroxylase)
LSAIITHHRRHCDNPDKNGRILTAILYLNPDWSEGDGGELQLTQTRVSGADIAQQDEQRLIVIPPLMNRLLLFWSDRRCPHEVLPAAKHRYAVTTWYFNAQASVTFAVPCLHTFILCVLSRAFAPHPVLPVL